MIMQANLVSVLVKKETNKQIIKILKKIFRYEENIWNDDNCHCCIVYNCQNL